jgi:small subunit ribosomal protein S27e
MRSTAGTWARLLNVCIVDATACARSLTARFPSFHPHARSTTVFSHAQTVVICGSCSTVLCQPTGGKARLTEGCSFRKKSD